MDVEVLLELREYQKLAARTRGAYACVKGEVGAGISLCEEAGEVAGVIKKEIFHGHTRSPFLIARELGDVLWYVAEIATMYDLNLDDVAQDNLDKLWERYGGEFSSERSVNRK